MQKNTNDLSKFGHIEIKELIQLLTAYNEKKLTNLAKNFISDSIKFEFNPNSDYVFLVDSDYNTFMLNDNKLDLWIFTPYYGYEGFLDDIINNQLDDIIKKCNDNKEFNDIEYLSNMLEYSKDNKLIEVFNKKLLEYKLCDYVLNISI